jgi:hypothetical protein
MRSFFVFQSYSFSFSKLHFIVVFALALWNNNELGKLITKTWARQKPSHNFSY